MDEDEPEFGADREPLSPKAITERFADLNAGDTVALNNRNTPYEVVETDRYSVTVADPDGTHVTLSQNLQTGGWVIHEEIWWIDSDRSPD